MATYDNKNFLSLPFSNVGNRLGKWEVLSHTKGAAPAFKTNIDENALTQYNNEVRKQRTKIWEESDFKTPMELYSKYPLFAHESKFRVADEPTGDWLVDLDINWVYVNDAAELAQLCGRSIDAEYFAAVVSPVTTNGQEKYAAQLAQFGNRFKCTNYYAETKSITDIVEVYDENLTLLCICPSSVHASQETGIHPNTIHTATKNYNLCQGYYFRSFYDNNFKPKNQLPFEQIQDGRVVNRFATVKDAAKRLDIQPFAIYRLIREPYKVDQYGCHWRKNSSKN